MRIVAPLAAALLAIPAAAQAPTARFPCDRLGEALVESYAAPAAGPAPPGAPVAVVRKAVLYRDAAPLAAAQFGLDDPALAAASTQGGPVIFTRFGQGGQPLFCTRQRSEVLFGAGDGARPFLLRCLDDADGDGRWDGARFAGKLVRTAFPGGKSVEPTPPDAPPVRLPRPLALVAAVALSPGLPPGRRLVRTLTVIAVKGDRVTLRASEGVALAIAGLAGPDPAGDQSQVETVMRDGLEVPVGFARVRFARIGERWTASLAVPPPPLALSCDGAVVELSASWQILLAGGMATVARRDLDAVR